MLSHLASVEQNSFFPGSRSKSIFRQAKKISSTLIVLTRFSKYFPALLSFLVTAEANFEKRSNYR